MAWCRAEMLMGMCGKGDWSLPFTQGLLPRPSKMAFWNMLQGLIRGAWIRGGCKTPINSSICQVNWEHA